MARSQDEYDRRYVSVMLRKAHHLNGLLRFPGGQIDEALSLLAIDAPLILEAQRHAVRLAAIQDMAEAVHQFAGMELAYLAFGDHQWVCWARDSFALARERGDSFVRAFAEGNLARSLFNAHKKSDLALAHTENAIRALQALGDYDSRFQAAVLASMALSTAFEGERHDLLRVWLELAEGEPRLDEHSRCRVVLVRARVRNRELGREAATQSLREAVELAARHGCQHCSGFANAVAGQLLIRRRSIALPFYQQALEAYSQSRLWGSVAYVADVLLGLTVLAPEILPEGTASFGDGLGLTEQALYRLRCEEDSARPHEVAELAQRIDDARRALLAPGPILGRDRPHAALLAWVHANALRVAGRTREAGSLFLQVVTEFDTDLDPERRHQAYYFALRSLMVRSREEIKNDDIGAMLRTYREASELALPSRYADLIAEVELEIASRHVRLYLWALEQGLADDMVRDAANLFTDSWDRVPPADCLLPELRDRRLTLLETAQEAGLLPV